MNELEGKIALITGGNSGIGLATAKQFVNEGAYIFITDRRETELAAAVKDIRRDVTKIQGDVSKEMAFPTRSPQKQERLERTPKVRQFHDAHFAESQSGAEKSAAAFHRSSE
jgi:NAD(P)-dependent dehydrogenase (short-subunit alcohol dehydrogenase family)